MKWFIVLGIAVWLVTGPTETRVRSETPAGSGGGPGLQNHKLVGITYGDPRDRGAVFEDPRSKKQEAYRIGDRIEGATITAIERQKVHMERGGETFTLYLSKGSPGIENTRDTVKDAFSIPVADPQDARLQILAMVIDPTDPRVEDRRRPIQRDDLKHLSDQIRSIEKPGPVFVTTTLGPTLSLARIDSSVLATLGLESTDLVVGVSGMGIDSWDRLNQILGILDRAKVMNITVLRGSAVKPLYYEVKPTDLPPPQ